jgi:hypothetical protein
MIEHGVSIIANKSASVIEYIQKRYGADRVRLVNVPPLHHNRLNSADTVSFVITDADETSSPSSSSLWFDDVEAPALYDSNARRFQFHTQPFEGGGASRSAIVLDLLEDELVITYTMRACFWKRSVPQTIDEICKRVIDEVRARSATLVLRIVCSPKEVELPVRQHLFDAGVALSPNVFNCLLSLVWSDMLDARGQPPISMESGRVIFDEKELLANAHFCYALTPASFHLNRAVFTNYLESVESLHIGSSAANKLREVCVRADITLRADMVALDIGAAPGGWTVVLSDVVSRVVAVDAAELDARVAARANVVTIAVQCDVRE